MNSKIDDAVAAGITPTGSTENDSTQNDTHGVDREGEGIQDFIVGDDSTTPNAENQQSDNCVADDSTVNERDQSNSTQAVTIKDSLRDDNDTSTLEGNINVDEISIGRADLQNNYDSSAEAVCDDPQLSDNVNTDETVSNNDNDGTAVETGVISFSTEK